MLKKLVAVSKKLVPVSKKIVPVLKKIAPVVKKNSVGVKIISADGARRERDVSEAGAIREWDGLEWSGIERDAAGRSGT